MPRDRVMSESCSGDKVVGRCDVRERPVMMVKLARRRTGRPGRVTGNQRTGACGRRAPVAGRDPINIYGSTTTASAAVHTVKDGCRPIAARPLLNVPATASSLITLRRRWVPVMGGSGGGGDRCEADRRRAYGTEVLANTAEASDGFWLAHRCRRELVLRVNAPSAMLTGPSDFCAVRIELPRFRRGDRRRYSFTVPFKMKKTDFILLAFYFEHFSRNAVL